MRSILKLLTFLFLACPLLAWQGQEVLTLNRKVLDACFAEKWDEALGYLGQIDKLQPEGNGTAYNYACVYSRKGEPDKAFEWLDKAVQWGWGGSKGAIATPDAQGAQLVWHSQMLETDKDLDTLRKDARFAKILERAKALQKRTEEYVAAPALYVPEKLKDAPELPVLLVLHASGGDKQATLAAWKGLADELGCALAAPAAPYPLREDASRGWGWIDDPSTFAVPNRTAEYQRPVHAALDALRKTKKLSASRVWIAGEGEGATLALVTGLHNSGLLKGAALLDPEVVAALCGYKVPSAKGNGLRLEARFDAAAWKARGVESPLKAVQAWELPGSASELAELKDAAARQAALVDAVRALAKAAEAAASPAPATAPK
jgi:poly(3-hydroxybutyrate) depolymerase